MSNATTDDILTKIDEVESEMSIIVDKAMNKAWNLGFLMGVISTLLFLFIANVIYQNQTANAHPCEYDNSNCHYIQVVNPITGNLETQYVCE